MMGRSHAVSGAASWLVGCVAVTSVGVRLPGLVMFVGAGVAAGAALLPDIDHPCSRVARSCGPVSTLVARLVAAGSARLHAATRTRLDRPDLDGHRTVSHTVLFALSVGVATAVGCLAGGRCVVAVVLAGLVGLGWSTMFGCGAAVAASAVFAAAVWWTPVGVSWWWLGVPTAWGCVAHCLGDALTDSGCPMLWPVKVKGRRWYPVGTPRAWRFGAGDRFELLLVTPCLVLIGLASAGWLLAIA